MTLLKDTAKLIAWLSGSLAGIAAILYSCGYIISQSYLHLLGVGGLFEYTDKYYVHRGAKFFIDMLGRLGDLLMPLFFWAILGVGVGVLLLKIRRVADGVARIRGWLNNDQEGLARFPLRLVAYISLLSLFFTISFPALELFKTPLGISDLLFYEPSSELQQGVEQDLKNAIIRRDQTVLHHHFNLILIAEFIAVLLLLVTWRVASPWKWRTMLISPFVLVCLLYLALLPMAYGTLMIRMEFHPTVIAQKNMTKEQTETLPNMLIATTSKAFILWNAQEKKVFWVPQGEVQGIELSRKQSILSRPMNSESVDSN